MRNINFIQPIPPHRHKEFRRWMLGSILIVISLFIALATISSMQWKIYHEVNQEKNILTQKLASYDQIMNKQHEQNQQKTSLQQKLAQLQAYSNHPKNPIDIITSIQKILGTVPLQSLSIDTNTFELKGSCAQAKHATQLVAKLNSIALCKNVQLCSISSGIHNDLQFIIKGKLT